MNFKNLTKKKKKKKKKNHMINIHFINFKQELIFFLNEIIF